MTITSLDGYRWLKNDIIRGNFQPDEKLRMSLLTSRYALGVGPLREALSQLVAERLVTVVNQKGYRVASMSEQELLDIFDARANMEAMLVSLAIARGGDEWEADVLAKAHLLSKLEACDASEKMLDEWDRSTHQTMDRSKTSPARRTDKGDVTPANGDCATSLFSPAPRARRHVYDLPLFPSSQPKR